MASLTVQQIRVLRWYSETSMIFRMQMSGIMMAKAIILAISPAPG